MNMSRSDVHMTSDEFLSLLGDRFSAYETEVRDHLTVSPLGELKGVADATAKFLLSDSAGRPRAVAICSSAVAPGIVMRGVKTAEAVRNIVGARLGEVIIQPTHSGYVADRSYAILPWYREFCSWRPVRVAQRLTLSRSLLDWLRDVNTAAATRYPPSVNTIGSFYSAIEHLGRQEFCTGEIAFAVRASLGRLDSGKWKPRHTVDHNDLWLGNVLLNSRNRLGGHTRHGFVVIDWVGANQQGFGIYDLIRLARGLKISDARLRQQILLHSEALHCCPEDTRGHLLACVGRLHEHLEYFPEERFIRTLHHCVERLDRVLPETR